MLLNLNPCLELTWRSPTSPSKTPFLTFCLGRFCRAKVYVALIMCCSKPLSLVWLIYRASSPILISFYQRPQKKEKNTLISFLYLYIVWCFCFLDEIIKTLRILILIFDSFHIVWLITDCDIRSIERDGCVYVLE